MADAKRYAVYGRALEVVAHALVAETIDIADSADYFPQEKRVRIDTRFRHAQHHAPEKYGKRDEPQGPGTVVLVSANLERVADALLERLSGRTIEQPKLAEEAPDDDEDDI